MLHSHCSRLDLYLFIWREILQRLAIAVFKLHQNKEYFILTDMSDVNFSLGSADYKWSSTTVLFSRVLKFQGVDHALQPKADF